MTLLKLRRNLISVFSFILIFSSLSAQKNKTKDLEKQSKKLKSEINAIESMVNKTKIEKRGTITNIALSQKKIEVRQQLIGNISSEIASINHQINTNQKQVESLKASLAKLKKDYAKTVYYAYRNRDSYSKLMFIFASTDFNQAYQRIKYYETFNTYRKQQASSITKTQTEINTKIVELEDSKNEKKQLLTSEEQEKLVLIKEKSEHETVLMKLQDKEKQLKEELEKKKKDAEALQASIKKIIADEMAKAQAKIEAEKKAKAEKEKLKKEKEALAKKNQAKGIPTPKEPEPKKEPKNFVPDYTDSEGTLGDDFAVNKGKLPWPVAKGTIVKGFGTQLHARIANFETYNYGVDIATGKGSAARAVFEGVVTGVTSVPGSGKVVIIRHGEFLTVYNNLSEVSVKTGDKITVKQSIGTIMFDEDEDATVLGFQVWKGTNTLNPAEWLNH